MCVPHPFSAVRSNGTVSPKAMSVEGVNLNNLKDMPRQLALTTASKFKPLPGIALNQIADPTAQQRRYG